MIDIVMITTLTRVELFHQSMVSLLNNRYLPLSRDYTLTIVLDSPDHYSSVLDEKRMSRPSPTLIINDQRKGASASRNIGASSIPKYRRQSHVMFLDDDVFMCPKWDEKLMELAWTLPHSIISGHAHPYNHAAKRNIDAPTEGLPVDKVPFHLSYEMPLVISTVCMLMPWSIWDDVGYFTEPGGPGGSEDYDYCMRAKTKGYGFAVTEPQCVIHTGITSSNGKPIVGADVVQGNNAKLEMIYGIEGKVVYG
jgi:GT2 family glycosyltransferase